MISYGETVHRLINKLQGKAKFQFHHKQRSARFTGYNIAGFDLGLNLIALTFEEGFDGGIKFSFTHEVEIARFAFFSLRCCLMEFAIVECRQPRLISCETVSYT